MKEQPNFPDRLIISIQGHRKTNESLLKEGWKNPMPLYWLKCSKHGYVKSRAYSGNDLRCPQCLAGCEKMTEKPKDASYLQLYFYIFAIVTVIVIARAQSLSILSAHSLIGMLLMKQIQIVFQENMRNKELRSELDLLTQRMDRLDPYSKDIKYDNTDLENIEE